MARGVSGGCPQSWEAEHTELSQGGVVDARSLSIFSLHSDTSHAADNTISQTWTLLHTHRHANPNTRPPARMHATRTHAVRHERTHARTHEPTNAPRSHTHTLPSRFPPTRFGQPSTEWLLLPAPAGMNAGPFLTAYYHPPRASSVVEGRACRRTSFSTLRRPRARTPGAHLLRRQRSSGRPVERQRCRRGRSPR